MPTVDPERIPVVVSWGQCLERDALVRPVELMAVAAKQALAAAPGLRDRLDRLSVVNVVGRVGAAPATALAGLLEVDPPVRETTTIGGNTPQWLVNRAAGQIARGELRATLIAGAEALRSSRERRRLRAAGREVPGPGDGTDGNGQAAPPDPVVGDDHPGAGPAELAINLILPLHVYALLESVVAARAGHSAGEHRLAMGALLAPFTDVAAGHPVAWFPEPRSAAEIAEPGPDNRIVAQPYTKRMTAFLGSDQAAAILVCSLDEARRAGLADQAVFVWAGADSVDVRSPTARPDPGTSPAIAAAGRALFRAAGEAAGRAVTLDDVARIDLYSCFPSAVELAADALGLATDDPRGLTVTGGLPYFGGPGNNYTTHSIATLCERLRSSGGDSSGGSGQPELGLATGLGWFVTKHALGLYGAGPPPGGFRAGDTAGDQRAIDASAVPTPLEVPEGTVATVVAATAGPDGAGSIVAAPVIARLAGGQHVAAMPASDEVAAAMGSLDPVALVGTPLTLGGSPPRYRLDA
jgi:acetyl-CoA C-acetyltransferase